MENLTKILRTCESELSGFMAGNGGPLSGFGIHHKGYIILLWSSENEVNTTMMDEIYSVISEAGKKNSIKETPVGFILFHGIKGD